MAYFMRVKLQELSANDSVDNHDKLNNRLVEVV